MSCFPLVSRKQDQASPMLPQPLLCYAASIKLFSNHLVMCNSMSSMLSIETPNASLQDGSGRGYSYDYVRAYKYLWDGTLASEKSISCNRLCELSVHLSLSFLFTIIIPCPAVFEITPCMDFRASYLGGWVALLPLAFC